MFICFADADCTIVVFAAIRTYAIWDQHKGVFVFVFGLGMIFPGGFIVRLIPPLHSACHERVLTSITWRCVRTYLRRPLLLAAYRTHTKHYPLDIERK